MTEIVFFRNNMKKTNKISRISYFFRCPPKVPPNPTSIHIYIYIKDFYSIFTFYTPTQLFPHNKLCLMFNLHYNILGNGSVDFWVDSDYTANGK